MKKLLKMFVCMTLITTVLGCSKDVPQLDKEKIYKRDDRISIQYKAMMIGSKVEPSNTNDEYYVREVKDEKITIIDIQFYIENLQNKEIDLNDFISLENEIDALFDYEICIEDENFKNILPETKIAGNQKTIAHLLYYVDKEELKTMQEEKVNIPLLLLDENYEIDIKEDPRKITELKKEKPKTFENMKISLVSSVEGNVINPLNYDIIYSNYYALEKNDSKYLGVFVEIENKSTENLNVKDTFGVKLQKEKEEPVTAWISLLSEDGVNFEKETYEIPANSKRYALFFQEVANDDTPIEKYAFNIVIEGIPYRIPAQF